MKQKYICKRECGHKQGSFGCLIHQVKKLAEEVAEFQEAISEYLLCSMDVMKDPLEKLKHLREEWKDVKTMILGIEKYHKELLKE